MMTTVPSMAPGQRSLPAELRVDRSRAGTWDRLRAGLHGIGDDGDDSVDLSTLPDSGVSIDSSSLVPFSTYSPSTTSGLPWNTNSNGTITPATTSSPSFTSSGTPNVASLISGINQTLAISQGGGVAANGAIYGSAANGAAASLGSSALTASAVSSIFPLLLIGGGILLVMSMAGKK